MVSNQEEIPDVSLNFLTTQTTVNKPSANKSLRLFTHIFDVKRRTAICHVGYSESELRAIKYGCRLWTNKTKWKRHSKINEQNKLKLYTFITQHSQFL